MTPQDEAGVDLPATAEAAAPGNGPGPARPRATAVASATLFLRPCQSALLP